MRIFVAVEQSWFASSPRTLHKKWMLPQHSIIYEWRSTRSLQQARIYRLKLCHKSQGSILNNLRGFVTPGTSFPTCKLSGILSFYYSFAPEDWLIAFSVRCNWVLNNTSTNFRSRNKKKNKSSDGQNACNIPYSNFCKVQHIKTIQTQLFFGSDWPSGSTTPARCLWWKNNSNHHHVWQQLTPMRSKNLIPGAKQN